MRQSTQRMFDKPEDGAGAAVVAPPAAQSAAPAVTPDPAEPAAVTPAPVVPEPVAGAAPPKKTDWKDDRIASLTFQLNEERRTKAAATPPAQTPGETDADFARRVDEAATAKAGQMAAKVDWDRQCNIVAEQGKKEFPDFIPRITAIRASFNQEDPNEVAMYNELVATAMETGQAHRILYALGSDPGEYQRLMQLSPVKRAMEIGTLAQKLVASPEPSGAPKPITPIVGSNGEHYEGIAPDDPKRGTKLPKAQWFKERQKQADERGLQ